MESQNTKDSLLQLNLHIQVQSLYPLLTYVSSDAPTPFIPFADNSWLIPRYFFFSKTCTSVWCGLTHHVGVVGAFLLLFLTGENFE